MCNGNNGIRPCYVNENVGNIVIRGATTTLLNYRPSVAKKNPLEVLKVNGEWEIINSCTEKALAKVKYQKFANYKDAKDMAAAIARKGNNHTDRERRTGKVKKGVKR